MLRKSRESKKAAYTGNVLRTSKLNAVLCVKSFHARHTMIQKKPFTLNRF